MCIEEFVPRTDSGSLRGHLQGIVGIVLEAWRLLLEGPINKDFTTNSLDTWIDSRQATRSRTVGLAAVITSHKDMFRSDEQQAVEQCGHLSAWLIACHRLVKTGGVISGTCSEKVSRCKAIQRTVS